MEMSTTVVGGGGVASALNHSSSGMISVALLIKPQAVTITK
jgi:hypothetical protein